MKLKSKYDTMYITLRYLKQYIQMYIKKYIPPFSEKRKICHQSNEIYQQLIPQKLGVKFVIVYPCLNSDKRHRSIKYCQISLILQLK